MKKIIAVLIAFLFAALANLYAQTPVQPTLPQRTVSLALPAQGTSTCPTLTTGSNCIRNVPASNIKSLQNAINAATCGDTIVLAAGSTYSGNFTIPQTSCTNNSGWIEIQSSAISSLPSPGNRVGPSNVSSMPTISTPNTAPAITFQPQSNHWRLMGLEITTSYVSTSATVYNLILPGLDGSGKQVTSVSLLPSYIILDRSYLHGLPTTNTTRGMDMDGAYVAVVDSYCDEIHSNSNDAQCFASWNGIGPFLIQNNFIQASTENIMFGGSDPTIANLVPSDITIIGNLIQKNLTWRGQAAPYNWSVKNLFELKNAQRVLLDGNVLQYTWAASQAEAIIVRSADQDGTCTWCVVQDVTITHNLIQHAPMGIQIAEPDSTFYPSLTTARVLIRNNLLNDINSGAWGGHGWAFEFSTNTTYPPPHDITIDHDTSFSDQALMIFGDTGVVNNLQLTNLIGNGAIFGTGTAPGVPTLSTFVANLLYNDIVILQPAGTITGTYPAGTFANTMSGAGLTNVNGTDPSFSGNFQLASGSPYQNKGTDGRDIGVWDWACLNSDSAAAWAGNFVQECTAMGNLGTANSLPKPPSNLNAIVN